MITVVQLVNLSSVAHLQKIRIETAYTLSQEVRLENPSQSFLYDVKHSSPLISIVSTKCATSPKYIRAST
jgi:hypothetical protein